MAGDKTEKATPKKREDARKKGQVAKSQDLNGATVTLCALLAISAAGPALFSNVSDATRQLLQKVQDPSVVDRKGIGPLMETVATTWLRSVAPIALACLLAGVVVTIVQVGLKPKALKPDAKKLNPLTGFKNIFGKNSLFEAGKSVTKVTAVGGIAALAVLPKLDEFASLVGMPPGALLPHLCSLGLGVAQRTAVAYLVIGFIDYGYQRWRHEKSLRMDKQEVRDEAKGQEMSGEIRGARRRRQMELSRGRMMDAVPTADVVVTNPTHYSVALRYSPEALAPVVVAKGKDIIAFRIREIAKANGVPVLPNPPLARALHASVEVNRMIPEELFQAVAELLAYVYRIAGANAAGSRRAA
jgi:flagellar biosynthetic protein FlhB